MTKPKWEALTDTRRGQSQSGVSVYVSGQAAIGKGVGDQFNFGDSVSVLIDKSAGLVGIKAADGSGAVRKVSRAAGVATTLVALRGAILALGFFVPRQATSVPWEKDGDMLVLDMSGLEKAEEGR